MPVRRRRVLVALLLALLSALVTSAARPAGEAPLNVASIGSASPLAFGARLQANAWAGTWRTSDGATLNWVQTGNHVSGNWANNPSMQMEGTVSGNVLQGTWTNSDLDFYPWAGGPLELTLGASGNSWSGSWSVWDWGGPPLQITATRVGGGDTGTTPPSSTPPSSPPAQTKAPKVNAFRYTRVAKPGTRVTLHFSVEDDSGRAKARLTLFEGGQYIRNAGYNGKATGRKLPWTVALAANLKGPLFFCVWAKNAAGKKSTGAPRSSCAWVKLVVPIERVSNGCGGEGWDAVVAVENHFGNTSTYYGEDGTPYTVDFTDACNLHDAGYGGQAVDDKINGPPIDFHGWSRHEVDVKFRQDMEKLCVAQIPAEEQQALAECKTNFRYPTVRTVGGQFFDADPMTAGTQDTGTRSND